MDADAVKVNVAGWCLVLVAVAGAEASAADKEPVTLSSPKVEFTGSMRDDGKTYPRISLDVLVNKKPEKDQCLSAKVSCAVGDKRMTDKAQVPGKWTGMDEGDTRRVDMASFVKHPFDAAPASCEFSIRWGARFDDNPKEVAKYCWTPEGVKDGACPKK